MGKRHLSTAKLGYSGFKRPQAAEKDGRNKKFNHPRDETMQSPSPSPSGDSLEEHSMASDEELEEVVESYKEPSMYDNLLKTLGSASESLASAYKMRQRAEEGKSDSEEDLDADSESLNVYEEDDNGYDNESPKTESGGTILQKSGLREITKHTETNETDYDDASGSDGENVLSANGHSTAKSSTSTSSFNKHLGHKLSKDEIENLSKVKEKNKWKATTGDTLNRKWIGTGECFLEDDDMDSGYGLKSRLYKHWLDNYKASGGRDFHSSKQRSFFSLCNSYKDILHHNKKPFYLKGMEEDSSTMDAYLMHSLNHMLRTRDLVKKNDAKVGKQQESKKDEILNSDDLLDRGFTRPKVLILLPLASIAFRVVKRLIELTPSIRKTNVENNDRFFDEFGTGRSEVEEADENEGPNPQKSSKPSDFQALFGGNNNDHFMIGIKFTRGSIKLYNDFYSSDMIVSSPLGLITKIGEAEIEKERDVDYLSSIEILVIDHADVIAMQNWSHVSTVLKQLNCIPSKQHGTDIMRIRPWYLDGQAQFYRQTIILGYHLNPDINALFSQHCVNYRGKMKLVCDYKGVLPKVLLQVRQIYERFDAESIVNVDDARLAYFSKKVFPKIKDSIQGGIMIFISSYFEFVRVRNFLKSQDASFCLLGEYTKQSDISRARVWFFQGKRKIMLYTERAHFYHRYKIRGIQNLIMYSLPERKEFYPEIVNMLEGSDNMTSTVLFSRFDMLRLERIVGSGPANRMVKSEKGVFIFT